MEQVSTKRPDWDHYFMQVADLVKTRSTCTRRQVGAVLVNGRHIIATGYNGAVTGAPHCEDAGCIRQQMGIKSGERHELCVAVHAEQNALIQAAQYGISVAGATLYCTAMPCAICAKLIVNAGIRRVVYRDPYSDHLAPHILERGAVQLCQLT